MNHGALPLRSPYLDTTATSTTSDTSERIMIWYYMIYYGFVKVSQVTWSLLDPAPRPSLVS